MAENPNAGPRIRCIVCGDIIQSMNRHDMVGCSGGHVWVDGGGDYLRIVGGEAGFEVVEEPPSDVPAP